MASILGWSVGRFRAAHDKLGAPHQRKDGEGKTSTVLVNCPLWIAAWLQSESGGGGEETRNREQRKERIEEIQLRNAELDLGVREGRLVEVDAFFRDRLAPCLDEIRAGVELVDRWPDAQRILVEQLQSGIERLRANGSSHHLTGDRSAGAGGGGTAAPENSAHASAVRSRVRQDAGRRSSRRPKVP